MLAILVGASTHVSEVPTTSLSSRLQQGSKPRKENKSSRIASDSKKQLLFYLGRRAFLYLYCNKNQSSFSDFIKKCFFPLFYYTYKKREHVLCCIFSHTMNQPSSPSHFSFLIAKKIANQLFRLFSSSSSSCHIPSLVTEPLNH